MTPNEIKPTRSWWQYLFVLVGFLMFVFSVSTDSENYGAAGMMLGIFFVFVGVWFTREPKTSVNASDYDISYTIRWRRVTPVTSIVLTIISLFWLLIEKIQKTETTTAVSIFVAFLLIDSFEYIIQWARATKYTGYTMCLDAKGVTVVRGNWSKQLAWQDFSSFCNVYEVRFGDWIRYIPFLSALAVDSDKYTLNLYKKISSAIPYSQIATNPDNYEQVVTYIKKYLPYTSSNIKLRDRI